MSNPTVAQPDPQPWYETANAPHLRAVLALLEQDRAEGTVPSVYYLRTRAAILDQLAAREAC